jgi:hypothetical protein
MDIKNLSFDREDLLRRVSAGDHSKCQHDLLGTCPVELALAISETRKRNEDAENLPEM